MAAAVAPEKNALVCPPVWLRDQSKVSASRKGCGKERAQCHWPRSCKRCFAQTSVPRGTAGPCALASPTGGQDMPRLPLDIRRGAPVLTHILRLRHLRVLLAACPLDSAWRLGDYRGQGRKPPLPPTSLSPLRSRTPSSVLALLGVPRAVPSPLWVSAFQYVRHK